MILDEITKAAAMRLEKQKTVITFEEMKEKAEKLPVSMGFPFEKSLTGEKISFICEVKKASPSKGLIASDFPYLEIAKEYEQAGASAISVLTEPEFFQGSCEYLKEIAESVMIPVLRKDFIIDAYQIYEAKIIGASAVLLICAILSPEQLKEYLQLAHRLGLSALVEAHTKEEVQMAVESGAKIIGINNRNLKTFQVDITTSARLGADIPKECIFVSESGIRTPKDVADLKAYGVNAVLIGETFMRSPNKKEMLKRLQGECGQHKVKMCGLFRDEDIAYANEVKPDFVGFVFAPSKRQITVEQAERYRRNLDKDILTVGVFVKESVREILTIAKAGIIDYIQLHGEENLEKTKEIQEQVTQPVIQAFSIEKKEDLEAARKSPADYLLFDYGAGGTGKSFSWDLFEEIPPFEKPVFLAGGIHIENIRYAMEKIKPYCIDVSSGIESEGKKDLDKMKAIAEVVKEENAGR